MKKDGKYRFSLQFPADTQERIQVGELLERLGNRKSTIVVEAVTEYLAAHPDLQNTSGKVKVDFHSGWNLKDMEQMIRTILEEKLATMGKEKRAPVLPPKQEPEGIEAGIAQMLDNLDLFS